MRLTATISSDFFATLVGIANACGNEIILHFSESTISLCVPPSPNQVSLWIGCKTLACFNKYTISSKTDNSIVFKCNAQQLYHSLSFEGSPNINFRLSGNKEFKCFEFEHNSADRLKKLSQKVEVTILSNSSIEQLHEPEWTQSSIAIKIPSFKSVLSWINEMKDINSLVVMNGTPEGVLGFHIENESVSISTQYSRLEVIGENNREGEVLIEVKKLKKILKVGNIPACVGVVYIYDKQMARFHFVTQSSGTPVQLTYILNATTKAN